MGLCLSCLESNDEYDANERRSLLGNETFSDEDLQEDLVKQQKRQNELLLIVNDLTENLIDASSFLSKQQPGPETLGPANDAAQNLGVAASPNPVLTPDDSKQLPYIWSPDQKIELMKQLAMSHETFDVLPAQNPLFVVF